METKGLVSHHVDIIDKGWKLRKLTGHSLKQNYHALKGRKEPLMHWYGSMQSFHIGSNPESQLIYCNEIT